MNEGTCKEEGCEKSAWARDWCPMHYQRWRLYGDPSYVNPRRGPQPTDPVGRFWAKVDKDGPTMRPELGPCWLWTAGRDRDGYGTFSATRGVPGRAHRFSWELHHGPIPSDKPEVLHHCDNPPCVNPAHLFVGTKGDNRRDSIAKGRNRKTKVNVAEAQRLRGEGWTLKRLGERYGVTLHAVHVQLKLARQREQP